MMKEKEFNDMMNEMRSDILRVDTRIQRIKEGIQRAEALMNKIESEEPNDGMELKVFHDWLETCPSKDYLITQSFEGLRYVRFLVKEENNES